MNGRFSSSLIEFADSKSIMKNKYEVIPKNTAKKPAKAQVSDAEFRRRLKNIAEWRKKHLAELRAKNPR
jgi:hypothetical protein